jgi:hypothetical protein
VFVSHSPWLLGCGAGHVYKAPQIWMNLGDLLGEPRYTPHTDRLSGCCGLSDTAPNRICQCGEHIGTEQSDCFTPRMFIPDPATTEWNCAASYVIGCRGKLHRAVGISPLKSFSQAFQSILAP